MYSLMRERSTSSAGGSQSGSGTGRLYLMGGFRNRGRAALARAADVTVERAHQLHRELNGAGQRLVVHLVGGVVVRVVVGGADPLLGADQGDRAEAPGASGKGIGVEGDADRSRAVGGRGAGGGDRGAQLAQPPVHRVCDYRALAVEVVDGAVGEGVEVDEVGAGAVELLAVAPDPRRHSLRVALLRPGEEDPDIEVLRRLGVKRLSGGEHRGYSGGVVVGAGNDAGEGDVNEQDECEEEDEGGEELDDAQPGGVDAGQPEPGGEEQR